MSRPWQGKASGFAQNENYSTSPPLTLGEGEASRPLQSLMLKVVSHRILDFDELAHRVVEQVLALDSPYAPRRPDYDVRANVARSALRLTQEQLPKRNQFFGSVLHAFVTFVSFLLLVTSGLGGENGVLVILFGFVFLFLGGSLAFHFFPEQQERRLADKREVGDLVSQVEELAVAELRRQGRIR